MAAFREARMTPSLRLTPRQSPLYRTPNSRSPVKSPSREENCLSLKQVIGTTALSANGFDYLESQRSFAFIAGAAAVIAVVDHNLRITQRFFRAKPVSAPPSTPLYDSPTPLSASNGARVRLGASQRDSTSGQPPFSTSLDSPDARGSAVRDRAKAATCVALSRDDRWIALGETGHRPRVLLFSTAQDAPSDVPVASISEHTFGVRCIAFSPDSQYLASLGEVNDGFLFIWKINRMTGAASLHSSNKCTSYVRQSAWLGNNLVTVGVRHVKIWRVGDVASTKTSPGKRYSDVSFSFNGPSKPLSGRNCLLGPLLDKAFTCIVPISAEQAIVCSEDGDICVLDDTEAVPRFTKVAQCGICINAATRLSQKSLVVGGSDGEMKVFNIPTLLDAAEKRSLPPKEDNEKLIRPTKSSAHILAMVPVGNNLLTLDSTRHMQILNLTLSAESLVLGHSMAHRYPAHGAAVLGVQALNAVGLEDAAFLTYSAEGSVLFWNAYGVCVRDMMIKIDQIPLTEEDPLPNELKVVRAFKGHQYLISGDRLGIMKIIEFATGKCIYETRAHSSEITDFGVYENRIKKICFIASSGRDRMGQVFRLQDGKPSGCQLAQTLDEHVGAVTSIVFTKDAKKLISSSSDRTIVVRESFTGELGGTQTTAYVIIRTITLKATPLSVGLSPQTDDELLVSTIDRHVSRYDIATGNQITTFKAADSDGTDSVIISSAAYMPLGQKPGCVACVSSTDKSIRVYDENGKVIGREYGHTEGMTGLAAISTVQENDRSSLVTVASDGTIFIWTVTSPAEQMAEMFEKLDMKRSIPATNVFATMPPLRRVLSSQELMSIQGRREEDGGTVLPTFRSRSRSPKRKVSKPSLVPTNGTALESVTERRVLRRSQTAKDVSKKAPSTPVDQSKSAETSDTSTNSTVVNGRVLRKTRSRGLSPAREREVKRTSPTTRTTARPSSVQPIRSRRKSVGAASATPEDLNSLSQSTEQICRALHVFRKKLGGTQEVLPHESIREIEKELSMTARALAEKAKSETVMVKLLDQYSERLLGMLDDKIRASVEVKMRSESELAVVEAEEMLGKH